MNEHYSEFKPSLQIHLNPFLMHAPMSLLPLFLPKTNSNILQKEQNVEDLIHNGMFPLSKSKITAFYLDTFLTKPFFVGRLFLHFDSCIQRGTTKLILLGNTPWKHF